MQAVFLHDALVTLGLDNEAIATTLRPYLASAAADLKDGHQPALVWQRLIASLADSVPVIATTQLARKPLSALARLQLRLARDRLVPGLTCHQSKGREWNTVAVVLSPADASALRHGLDPARANHRALCVAFTRARLNTLALT
jgi:DNA helicase-2/ATP-dependent DNA helicase PcrA